jgi:multiple antibiotic resistance protein
MDLIFTLKKTLTLLALVDPLLAVPIFISATTSLSMDARKLFCRHVAIAVGLALLIGGLFGLNFLSFMGVSLAAIQVGGGAIVFVVALAMVVSKEETVKHAPAETERTSRVPSIVPLAIPLLAGPAALSYVMATSQITQAGDLIQVVVPPIFIGFATWLCFRLATKGKRFMTESTLSIIERVSGFLLSAIAIEMMATGMKVLFPGLSGISIH